MGLMVYSLDNIPSSANRDYFIYLLDYGWYEPIAEVLRKNFDGMAKHAANNRAVVIKGLEAAHLNNEIFSWHHINNEEGDDVLPAILITNAAPQYFRDGVFKQGKGLYREDVTGKMKLILIPLKKFCSTTTEVVNLIEKLFADIEQQRDLSSFQVAKEISKGARNTIVRCSAQHRKSRSAQKKLISCRFRSFTRIKDGSSGATHCR